MHGTPRPPATPAQALSAMDHLIAAHLIGQQELARRLGLNVTDLTCFAFVLEAGENLLTAGDLAARAHVTTGAVTGILNRLERAGYVTRRPDPADRRRVRVAAVPAAVARVEAVYAGHYERLTVLFADYSADELAIITDWFTRATALAHEYLEKLNRNDPEEEC
ncbi:MULTISPECIES: MarR family transcriptional regulator [Streptomyces]|jgi:DNA-binding MarR family transcriptional regulator|uniref:MarR family transcriptional regulator n=2 Tax=Streptomyces TaxID=1883 RepID=A0ABY6EQK2_9ACTN|nr:MULTISPECIES: helix-turn-helix domain-containing protein [unclassified Streptomyces]OKJ85850.1 DNA-binding protein [Streptomyces sp. CB01883]ROP52301.1 DNA-binding MarR family transcriptional regulator [Streptomyces sp. PanSC9]UXY36667.1 MarR family transcriptional regulator [Streptomyces sp. HUAS 14-6]SED32646.1 DNA-binding transcriptional regulator, MarR family [Streptomyces sp. 2231.1]